MTATTAAPAVRSIQAAAPLLRASIWGISDWVRAAVAAVAASGCVVWTTDHPAVHGPDVPTARSPGRGLMRGRIGRFEKSPVAPGFLFFTSRLSDSSADFIRFAASSATAALDDRGAAAGRLTAEESVRRDVHPEMATVTRSNAAATRTSGAMTRRPEQSTYPRPAGALPVLQSRAAASRGAPAHLLLTFGVAGRAVPTPSLYLTPK